MSEKQIISRRSPWTFPLIIILALALSLWGLDRSILSNKSNVSRLDGRVLTQAHLQARTLAALTNAGIEQSHPDFRAFYEQVAKQIILQWNARSKLSSRLAQDGFEPDIKMTRKHLKTTLKKDKLTDNDIINQAKALSLNETQFILASQDDWRLQKFQSLLKASEIEDEYSTLVQLAINGQERQYVRYKLNKINPKIDEAMIKGYYETNKSEFIKPSQYVIDYVEISPSSFKELSPTIGKAKAYFKDNPSLLPKGSFVALALIKSAKPDMTKKAINALSIPKKDKSIILKKLAEGFSVSKVAQDINLPFGLNKVNDDTLTYLHHNKASDKEILNTYISLSQQDQFQRAESQITELAFTHPKSLYKIIDSFPVKQKQMSFSEKDIPNTWGDDIMDIIKSPDVSEHGYNSPVVKTTSPSYVVFRLKEVKPPKQLSLQESSDAIKNKLQEAQRTIQKNLLSIQILRQLENGELDPELKEKITRSEFTIKPDNMEQFSSIRPVVMSFLLFQSPGNPKPSFSLNSSIASLIKVKYPKLGSFKLSESAQPEYLDTYQLLIPKL